MSLPVSSHNRSASLCSPSSFTFVLLLLLPFGRTDRSLQLLFYPRTTLPQFSVFSLSFPLFDDASSPPRLSFPASRSSEQNSEEDEREEKKLLASWPFWQNSDYVVYRSVLWTEEIFYGESRNPRYKFDCCC